MYDNNLLLSELRASSVDRGDAVFAELDDGRILTFDALFEGAEKVAHVLAAKGLEAGDRVAVQVDKSILAVQVYLGTILAGGVFLPLNTAYTPAELTYFVGDAEPRVFICDPRKYEELKTIGGGSSAPAVLTLSGAGTGTLVDLMSEAPSGFQAVAREKDDLAAILYTSGTTGRSKGAMLTHGNLSSNAKSLCATWRFTQDDKLIHALPIFHTHGLFVAVNVTLMAGGSVFFMAKFDADAIMNLFSRATSMMGVPTFYVRLLDHPKLTKEAVAGMRLFVSGSAPLLAETHQAWRKQTGHAILERYGMTETNMNTSNPYEGDRRAGTVGFPLPGVEVRVADPATGNVLPDGETGSLEVRGPNVFKGYWRMPEKTKEEFRDDGFFITGDLGVIDQDGYISIVGRSKDLIISGGYNIYPKEIELLIDELDGVAESAVIGLPHPDFGEGVAAVIVPAPGTEIGAEKVMSHVAGKLARFKQPKQVFFVKELPRNTMGKVQKNLLRETYKDTFN